MYIRVALDANRNNNEPILPLVALVVVVMRRLSAAVYTGLRRRAGKFATGNRVRDGRLRLALVWVKCASCGTVTANLVGVLSFPFFLVVWVFLAPGFVPDFVFGLYFWSATPPLYTLPDLWAARVLSGLYFALRRIAAFTGAEFCPLAEFGIAGITAVFVGKAASLARWLVPVRTGLVLVELI